MLSNITWWQFTITLLILLLIYYPIILWIYFRKDLTNLLEKYNQRTHNTTNENTPDDAKEIVLSDNKNQQTYNSASEAGMAADLMQDIAMAVTEIINDQGTKEELLSLLKSLLNRYAVLKQSAQKVELNEFIIEECKRFPIKLTMAETYALWV